MKIGVTVPNNWGIEDVQQVLAFGPLAEQLGFDSVWVMDHLFNNGYIGERLNDKPYYHPLAHNVFCEAMAGFSVQIEGYAAKRFQFLSLIGKPGYHSQSIRKSSLFCKLYNKQIFSVIGQANHNEITAH